MWFDDADNPVELVAKQAFAFSHLFEGRLCALDSRHGGFVLIDGVISLVETLHNRSF
ncbi:hypothetical protein IV72_GL000051 [Atopobium minutum]|nr:hypothetical protein HMPREF1247_1086 [Atopobium sp. BV3Ac4]KRN56516.1 hypothetical protein IV72_GL000051 [Atopobium minutum]